jgi:SAM-dependent methyltransferase
VTTSRFDDLTDVYEAMVDWPRRLANDEPFFRQLFEEVGARRVADVACGTGHHAAMFHSWGLHVEAADISANMIDHARHNFGEPDGLNWSVRSFEQSIPVDAPLDAVTCLGNSLGLAGDLAIAERAIESMFDALRPGGLLVLHVLNVWRLPDGPCQWQKCVRTALPQGESLITKGVQRVGDRAFVHLLVAPLDAPEDFRSESVPFLALEAEQLGRFVQSAGAGSIQFYGDQKHGAYDRQSSVDLILVANKN